MRVAASGLLLVMGGACVLLTALPISALKAWWVRVWDFPRQQIAILGALAGLGWLALEGAPRGAWELGFLLLLGAAVLYQAAFIIPYTRLWRPAGIKATNPPGPRSLSLVITNVLMSNREASGLAESLRACDPDIVLALETDAWWVETLSSFLPEHRHRLLHPLDNTYGIALYSRLELIGPELRFLLKEDIPSIRTRVRLRSGEDVLLIGLHPEPPAPEEADTSLPRDAELVMVGREVADEAKAVIVAGDLNDVAWSHTSRLFRRLSGLIDPRVGRGFYNSFHAGSRLMRWPLDHVFHSPELVLRELRRLPAYGSDHFPIYIALDFAPGLAEAQPVEEAEPEDLTEAKATVKEALQTQAD